MQVKSICIVGGGSSGWMAASAIATNLPDIKLTVIEPPDIPTVGVGESTLGHINRYLQCIGLEGRDKDWMPYCQASYKVSIQFTDFKEKGHVFQYPFGKFDYSNDKTPESWAYIKNLFPEFDQTYSEFYNPITYLASTNKMIVDNSIVRNFNFNNDTAYHFDAQKFGEWLKNNICIPNGVKVIRDSIQEIVINEDGEIELLISKLNPQMRLKFDLYIDCTGFKSMLLEQKMGSKFISFNDVLLNDTAIATRIPYENIEKELTNTTDCCALKNGWVWNIPLWSRIGTGYCYSSKFTTKEDAEKEFRNHIAKTGSKKRAEEFDFFTVDIRHGKRERAWVKNCIGIGLSYGFLEPLESTGLLTTHENILRLVDTLQKRNGYVTKLDRDGYNHAVDYDLESMKDFIVMHYVLSRRDDSEYWRYIKYEMDVIPPEMLNNKLVTSPRLYREFLFDSYRSHQFSNLEGTLYIANGMDYLPIGKTQTEFRFSENQHFSKKWLEDVKIHQERYKKQVLKYLKTAPTTFEFLKGNIYND